MNHTNFTFIIEELFEVNHIYAVKKQLRMNVFISHCDCFFFTMENNAVMSIKG